MISAITNMVGRIVYLYVCFILADISSSRAQDTRRLFEDQDPLAIRLSVSFRDLRRETNDSTFIPSVLSFKNGKGDWDSIPINIRTRGNFRKKNCAYPPLRIRIRKKDAVNTLFAGTKSLKLVLPCHEGKSNLDLVNKEYLCYKLYQPVTKYSLKTRLLDVTLVQMSKREKVSQINGFFIEDDDQLAERRKSKVIDESRLNPLQLEDTSALRLDFFQYMIANTDYSTTFFHNVKVVQTSNTHYVPIPYDFDMSGIVNAPYATIDPKWEIKSVRERVYKGFCRNEKVVDYVRQEYIDHEARMYEVIDLHEKYLGARETESLKKYIGEFFAILKNDREYKEKIVERCRSQN